MGRQIKIYPVLWVANYQLLKTTALIESKGFNEFAWRDVIYGRPLSFNTVTERLLKSIWPPEMIAKEKVSPLGDFIKICENQIRWEVFFDAQPFGKPNI